jgi:UTP--glucose-1-phosphate uridylyltransferase
MRARKAVVTAAGRGTRMFPATRSIQKEMLPLVDRDGLTRPTIEVIVADCLAAGIEEVCIVVEKGGRGPFEAHFQGLRDDERASFASKPWAVEEGERLAEMAERISYVEQPSPEGFGHAVYQAKDFVGDEPFVLLLGDHVFTAPPGIPHVVAQLLDAGASEGGSVTAVQMEPESGVTITGVVKCQPRREGIGASAPGQTYDILALKEKPSVEEARALASVGLPEGHYLCHFGAHLFTADIFSCLGELMAKDIRVKNEYQLTSGQEVLLRRSLAGDAPPYRAAYLNGTRWDIGMPDVYLETLIAYAQRGPFAAKLAEKFGLKPLEE